MGDFKFVMNEGLFYKNDFLSDFDNYVSRKIYIIDAQNMSINNIYFEIIIITKEGVELHPIYKKNFNKIKYFENWMEISDACLTNKARKLLVQRLQETVLDAPTEEYFCFERSGLIIEDNNKYLVVGNECFGSKEQRVVISDNLKKYKWRVSSQNVIFHSEVLNTMMNVAPMCSEILTFSLFAAVMKSFFITAGVPWECCLNLYGQSGTFKTSLVKAMINIIDTPELLWGSFLNDNKKELLDKIETGYGFVVLLDDYHPGARDYDMKKQTANMDAVARQMESNNRTSLVIMTSEFLDGCYSLQDRMIQLEIQSVSLELLSKLQNSSCQIAQLLRDFLNSITNNYEEVIKLIKKEFAECEFKRSDVSSRIDRNVIFLKIAAKLCSNYLFGGDKTMITRLEDALIFQRKIQTEHLMVLKKFENIHDYVIAFHQMVNSDVYEFCSAEKKEYSCKNNQICIKASGIIYMTKNALRYGMKVYYGIEQADVAKMVKALHENDILLEDSDAILKKFAGIRHLCILNSALEQYVESVNGNIK